ncbi:unnamed protein product, partial [Choristocarpus tenellus]
LNGLLLNARSKEGTTHPRISLFAKLCGVPICDADCDDSFHPFATTDYFLPILLKLVPPGEDIDTFLGNGREQVT